MITKGFTKTKRLTFCGCLAQREEGARCPRCSGDPDALGYCRRCTMIHRPSQTCALWRPETR